MCSILQVDIWLIDGSDEAHNLDVNKVNSYEMQMLENQFIKVLCTHHYSS